MINIIFDIVDFALLWLISSATMRSAHCSTRDWVSE